MKLKIKGDTIAWAHCAHASYVFKGNTKEISRGKLHYVDKEKIGRRRTDAGKSCSHGREKEVFGFLLLLASGDFRHSESD